MGIALVPEDRAIQGMIGDYSVKNNLSSVDMRKITNVGVIQNKKENSLAKDLINQLNIRPNDANYLMTRLSGGNQQKVVIGKWLTAPYKLYLMDEVTAGVDIEAKAAIYEIMGDIVKNGGAILLATGDIEEALGISDRILVLFKGKVVKEIFPSETTKDELLTYIMGGGTNA
jgi:ribose transport system ATP-binding protein